MACDIGVVGLGVMGGNLALNMERHGFRIAGYDLDAAKARAWADGPAAGLRIEIASSPDALMAMLSTLDRASLEQKRLPTLPLLRELMQTSFDLDKS